MTIGFHPLADRELTEAGQFYEARAQGLGSRLLEAAERVVQLLDAHPELGSPLSAAIRSFPIHRFPYSLVYRLEPDRLFVVAVAHHRRRPQYWTGRIR